MYCELECLVEIFSFYLNNSIWSIILLDALCRCGNWGMQRLRNLQKFLAEQTMALQMWILPAHLAILWYCLYDLQAPFLMSTCCECWYLSTLQALLLRPNSIWTHVLTGSFLLQPEAQKEINKSTHAQELVDENERDHSRLKWLKWQKVKCTKWMNYESMYE